MRTDTYRQRKRSLLNEADSVIRNYTVGLTGETVSVNPRCWKIFKRVPRLGVALQDSLLATED